MPYLFVCKINTSDCECYYLFIIKRKEMKSVKIYNPLNDKESIDVNTSKDENMILVLQKYNELAQKVIKEMH